MDKISFSDFGKIAESYLEKKRLFISACKVVNKKLADAVIPISKCMSIIGPYNKIDFDESAIMWAAFYYLAFKESTTSISNATIHKVLQKVVDAFGVSLNYFARTRSGKINRYNLRPKS